MNDEKAGGLDVVTADLFKKQRKMNLTRYLQIILEE